MSDAWGQDQTISKAHSVAVMLNRILQTLSVRCAKEEGVRGYFEIAAIGYGATVGNAFGGSFQSEKFISISDLANQPLRLTEVEKKVEDGAGGLVSQTVKIPMWFEDVSNNGTPMCRAINMAHEWVSEWIGAHPNAFPPTVINISDGQANDGDPTSVAAALTSLATSDGNVLMYNACISSDASTKAITFPDSGDSLPDEYARLMFGMSSVLTPYLRECATGEGFATTEGSRFFFFQADPIATIQFLDIGTRTANLR
jgi:hypothetical protein